MMNYYWVSSLINSLNSALDRIAPTTFGIGLLIGALIYTYYRMKAEGVGKGIYLGGWVLIESAIFLIILDFVPKWLYGPANPLGENIRDRMSDSFRWLCIWLIIRLYWRYINTKNDETGNRGVNFVTLILATLTLGWLLGRWIGMMFVSVPVLLIFEHVIHQIAQVVLPASGQESFGARIQRTVYLLAYLAGVQYPIWVAEASVGRKFEERIKGDQTNDFGRVGIVLTRPHQVAGISINIAFNGVRGPGLIFTGPFEVPVALVDLRKQNRVTDIEAVTKDGMKIQVKAVTVFMIDNQPLEHPEYTNLRHATKRNFRIDHPQGSFPYSSGRVRTALSVTGISQPLQTNDNKAEIYWDHWVATRTEQAVRQVIAERTLDELWHPRDNDRGTSALDEMANDLKKRLEPILIRNGIQLFAARIVTFIIKEGDSIIKQNIKTWGSYWEQRIAHADAETEVIYREEIEKAHAYSKSLLLNAIAESITKARRINSKLPRHVIAQYFVHALEEYIKGQPGLNIEASKKRLGAIREILYFHAEGNE